MTLDVIKFHAKVNKKSVMLPFSQLNYVNSSCNLLMLLSLEEIVSAYISTVNLHGKILFSLKRLAVRSILLIFVPQL